MFQTAAGVSIPFPERMKEQYQVYPHALRFVLSFEKIRPMLLDFIDQLEEPLFVVLEMPLSQKEESKLRKCDTDPFHKKVCYLDMQSKEKVSALLATYGEILFNDGISQFAIASHVTNDEFFIRKYKLIDLYSNTPTKFIDLLNQYGLTETSNLITMWDTFSQEQPGSVRCIQYDGKDIYSVSEALEEMGMYVAKVEAE